MSRDRFMYWAPWGVTRPWLPRIERGGDEWHNASVLIVLPLLGAFIYFYERNFNRDDGVHVSSHGPGGFEGRIVVDCESCEQFVGMVHIAGMTPEERQ